MVNANSTFPVTAFQSKCLPGKGISKVVSTVNSCPGPVLKITATNTPMSKLPSIPDALTFKDRRSAKG